LLDKVELKALIVYREPIYRLSRTYSTQYKNGSSHKARGEGTCPRPKAEKKDVIDKWVIAYSERGRMARGRRHNQSVKVQGLNPIPKA
jgi:hypothetical protein